MVLLQSDAPELSIIEMALVPGHHRDGGLRRRSDENIAERELEMQPKPHFSCRSAGTARREPLGGNRSAGTARREPLGGNRSAGTARREPLLLRVAAFGALRAALRAG
jgi:hypothetical protein